jgi:hereditary spastic paraplegia protein strumpellin
MLTLHTLTLSHPHYLQTHSLNSCFPPLPHFPSSTFFFPSLHPPAPCSYALARATHSVSVFTEGILAMETTLVGVIEVSLHDMPLQANKFTRTALCT